MEDRNNARLCLDMENRKQKQCLDKENRRIRGPEMSAWSRKDSFALRGPIVPEMLTMLLSCRHSRSRGREREGRMVGEGRELGLGRDGAAPSISMETGSTCWCKYKLSCICGCRCRCR